MVMREIRIPGTGAKRRAVSWPYQAPRPDMAKTALPVVDEDGRFRANDAYHRNEQKPQQNFAQNALHS
jgi:hypothetical protein